ncbi:MAG: hypothetical protein LBT76_03375 [Tannerella sp.]|nr:hypothetical protein [Tannerella sp.]
MAVIMSGIMALGAVQPAFALHFCADTLVSVGPADAKACCCNTTADEDGRSAQERTASGNGISEPVESCCSNYLIELATDDFQPSSRESAAQESAAAVPVFLPADACPGFGEWNGSPQIQRSPPGKPAAGSTDLLAIFCLLRL